MTLFNQLGLNADILSAIEKLGYTQPTEIQAQAIPAILQGRDLMGGSRTGTGKTAAFTLPLLHLLSANPFIPASGTSAPAQEEESEVKPGRDERRGRGKFGGSKAGGSRFGGKFSEKSGDGRPVRSLILAPTRELANQIAESVRAYAKNLPLRAAVVYGGVAIRPQMAELKRGVDILIATPGRLLDLISQRAVSLGKVQVLILDEADRMFDMGFADDLRSILALIPKERQTLLFSATFSPEIKRLAAEHLKDPVHIQVSSENTAAKTITQISYPVDRRRKFELLLELIVSEKWNQALIFTRTKHMADQVTEQLEASGIRATAIHSSKSQAARTRALASFKRGDIQMLVGTDVAARGLDIPSLPHVVNYELPNVPEDYLHRIGRTGRAGNEGKAISLVSVCERNFLRDIERFMKGEIKKVLLPGFAPNPAIKSEPVRMGGRGGSGGSRSGGAGFGGGGFGGGRSGGSRPGGFGGRSGGKFGGRSSESRFGSRTDGSRSEGSRSEGSRSEGSRAEGGFESKRDFGPRREDSFDRADSSRAHSSKADGFKSDSGFKPRFGADRREGGFKPRFEGKREFTPRSDASRGESASFNRDRAEGSGFERKREFGESRFGARREGSSDFKPRFGGSEGGFKPRFGGSGESRFGDRREGGFKPKFEGKREGGFKKSGGGFPFTSRFKPSVNKKPFSGE